VIKHQIIAERKTWSDAGQLPVCVTVVQPAVRQKEPPPLALTIPFEEDE